jgi:hypothetical protein
MPNVISVFTPLAGLIVLVWILSRLILANADEGRQASARDGQLEFAPNRRSFVAAAILVALLVYMGISLAVMNSGSIAGLVGAAFWILCAALILAAFPGSILFGDEGLQQVYWLWRRRIAWTDISKIEIDEKRKKVTITGRRGARIAHLRQLPDKARLLEELGKHCGDKLPAAVRQEVRARQDMVASF